MTSQPKAISQNPLKTKRSTFEPTPTKPLSTRETSSRIKIRFKKFHSVANWQWGTPADEVCGICQTPFEGCAPGVKYPGDECPVVWGKCKHAFHLQCVSTWLGGGKTTCPICRREWEFGDNTNTNGEEGKEANEPLPEAEEVAGEDDEEEDDDDDDDDMT